jgi:CubicO group peptidase (beta-lactamase class C family)
VFWDASKNADNAMAVLLGRNDLVATDTSVAYLYSNTNFFILERIIEQVSGQKYENYIRTNVLNKSGIGNSMYVGNANGSIRSGETHYTPMTNMNLQLWAGFGGWVARPMDLLKFLNRVDGAASPSDILTASIQKTMTTGSPQSMGYGFGWGVSGSLQNHNGCHGSSRSFLVELANGVSYAVIINSSPTNDGCGWTMKSDIEKGLAKVLAYPSYNLFDNIGSGRVEAADEASTLETSVESSDLNLVTAYPKPSLDGTINFSNAANIKSITVIDVLGNKEVYPAASQLRTQLKGLLILQIETEQGKVIEKVVVE